MKLIGRWIKSNPKSYAYFKAMYKCIFHEQGPTITCSRPTDNFGANADTTFEEFVSGEVMHYAERVCQSNYPTKTPSLSRVI